jgi:hypothetical protein
MEIIMKLKQSGNKQFEFLSHNDPLHPYYKHVLTAIKSGAYTPSPEEEPPTPPAPQGLGSDGGGATGDQEEEEDGGHYLHPLLASKPYNPPPQPPQPSLQVHL